MNIISLKTDTWIHTHLIAELKITPGTLSVQSSLLSCSKNQLSKQKHVQISATTFPHREHPKACSSPCRAGGNPEFFRGSWILAGFPTPKGSDCAYTAGATRCLQAQTSHRGILGGQEGQLSPVSVTALCVTSVTATLSTWGARE